ncbi:cytochrome P450 [Striga asiatica]|uniref:Flavonoid-6-hydroxylase n=1 Tax=Striga asiatica TaxID=4170 RepID=A0A5A7QZU5_STRAF|nr:cytochrome P450 [Striga asiatica]
MFVGFPSPMKALTIILLYNLRHTKPNSPPQPSGALPILGHLHLLARQSPTHRTLSSLADKYGPIFSIRLGAHKAVVISAHEPVRDCFTTNDKILAFRPASSVGLYLGYNYAGFGFTQGPYWREARKLVLHHLLSPRRLEKLKTAREAEIRSSFEELHAGGNFVIISKWFEELSLDVIVKMITGRRYTDTARGKGGRPFREVIKEFMYVSGQFVLSDAITFLPLRWVDFGGYIKAMKRISEELDGITGKWVDEHLERGVKSDDERDFIDVMLSEIDERLLSFGHAKETIIKATIQNLILAGSDTTSIHLTWTLSLLLNHPNVMQRAQYEIDSNIGKNRWAQESDIPNLPYLQAVIKESLRLYPPGPISVPHEASQDCCIMGYKIPKGTRIIVNLWKLHRDPRIWAQPEDFVPERFLAGHAGVDFNGQFYEFIPFGSGRRSCPGVTFAMQVAHLVLARLIQGFEIKTGLDKVVDMSEGMGITLPKATPLEVVITPRLANELYYS